jgi:peptidyl-prolyl cis-trans isomerase C
MIGDTVFSCENCNLISIQLEGIITPMSNRQWKNMSVFFGVGIMFILVSCNSELTPSPTVIQATPTAILFTPGLTPTPTVQPSATFTPEPLAAVVNGDPITLSEFQQELARYRQAQTEVGGTNLATEGLTEEMIVLEDLIDQTLLAQKAAEEGYFVDERQLEERYNQLAAQTDLVSWFQVQGFTEENFRQALKRSMHAAWMRDQVIAAVPYSMEQIHARQILLYNLEDANRVYANLQSGADFTRLAALYDPVAAGDIGWFPRGYLTESFVEQAVFDLEPGMFSPVIETRLGYHIIQVVEKDPQRQIEPDMRLVLQSRYLRDWLIERRELSEIQVLLP